MPDGTHWDQYSGSRWIPLVNYSPQFAIKAPVHIAIEILPHINRTARIGGMTDQLKIIKESCEAKINNLSSRYRSSQSESLKGTDIMAKRTRITKPADPVTPIENNTTAVVSPGGLQSPEVAVVVKDPVAVAFAGPLGLIKITIAEIEKFKAVTSEEEATALKQLMLNLNEHKKFIEKIHKELKAPALEECRKWDAGKKQILDGTDEALNGKCKVLLHGWDLKQREVQAEAQRKADLKRADAQKIADNEATRISDIKTTLDEFERGIAEKILGAKTLPELATIWAQDLQPFIPSAQMHGPFADHAFQLKDRLDKLGKACSSIVQAKDELAAVRIGQITYDEICARAQVTINQYSFAYEHAKEYWLIVADQATEEATIGAEIAKSQITGTQIMQQSAPTLQYRRVWRWEVQEFGAIGPTIKIPQPLQQLYIQVDGKYVPVFVTAAYTELFTLNTEKIESFVKETNASANPLFNGEVVDGIAFYVEETAVMPRS